MDGVSEKRQTHPAPYAKKLLFRALLGLLLVRFRLFLLIGCVTPHLTNPPNGDES